MVLGGYNNITEEQDCLVSCLQRESKLTPTGIQPSETFRELCGR